MEGRSILANDEKELSNNWNTCNGMATSGEVTPSLGWELLRLWRAGSGWEVGLKDPFWPHESRVTEETFQGLVKDHSRGHSTVGVCVLIRVKWIRLSGRKFSMPQSNKAMVVAGLKPRALCQHPKGRMQGVWIQLGAEPWIWPVQSRRGPEKCNGGGLVLFDSCSTELVGEVSQFPASYETVLAIRGS